VAKNVFRATEITHGGETVFIKPPELFTPHGGAVPEELEPLDEYRGPSADDLRREGNGSRRAGKRKSRP